MSYPIIEQIAQAIATQLATVTVGNGYNVTVAEVVRPTKGGTEDFEPSNMTVVLKQGDISQEDETQHQCIGWIVNFHIDCIARPSDTTTTPYDQTLNVFRSDVEKALMADSSFGITKTYSWIRPPTDIDDGIRVNLEVHFRTLETNPYSTG